MSPEPKVAVLLAVAWRAPRSVLNPRGSKKRFSEVLAPRTGWIHSARVCAGRGYFLVGPSLRRVRANANLDSIQVGPSFDRPACIHRS